MSECGFLSMSKVSLVALRLHNYYHHHLLLLLLLLPLMICPPLLHHLLMGIMSLRQLPGNLVPGKFYLRLPLVRLRQILTQKDVKSGHRPVSFTMRHAGIHRPRLWRLFLFPISLGKIIPASNHPQFSYRENSLGIGSCQAERQLFTETEIDEMVLTGTKTFFFISSLVQ